MSPMCWLTHAWPPDATQNVFFSSPPTARTLRRAPGIATGIGA